MSLRSNLEPSARVGGFLIEEDPTLPLGTGIFQGLDGYKITINPVQFGMNLNAIYDSIAANNSSTRRRVVIRTPFGTAIAPPGMYIFIQN
jgi:hypothetical protein